MFVRLKVKLAEVVNGLDLSHCVEGDVIETSDRDGAMLIAERWAEPAPEESVTCRPRRVERTVAADEGVPRGWRKARRRSTAPHEP